MPLPNQKCSSKSSKPTYAKYKGTDYLGKEEYIIIVTKDGEQYAYVKTDETVKKYSIFSIYGWIFLGYMNKESFDSFMFIALL